MKRYSLLILVALLLAIFTACAVVAPQESINTTESSTSTPLPKTSQTIAISSGTSTEDVPSSEALTTKDPTESSDTPLTSDTPTTSEDVVSSDTPITSIPPDPEEPPLTEDPYVGMSKDVFYQNYRPARSLADALYRSQHGFLSGYIEDQDQKPTYSADRPKENGLYIRNTSALYGDGGNSYSIVNARGEIVNTIYKGGGYVSLEEVAAYVYAFGDIPANYLAKKNSSPSSSIWGEHLRLNHTKFSGDTSRYRYEPELPRISGCGGDYYYYEIDIGTTGTDCDPAYTAKPYNNGYSITRGAARIVYSRFDRNNNKIFDPNEKFVFYTYNHYNDFEEYLNYEGGWGEMFGNITGGGKISSNSNCNPTPYVPTTLRDFTKPQTVLITYFLSNGYNKKEPTHRVGSFLFYSGAIHP